MADANAALERIELWAVRDLCVAAPPGLGVTVEQFGGGTLALAPLGRPQMTNRALGIGVDGPVDDDVIEALCAAGSRHHQPWTLALWPDAKPAGLEERLLCRGFQRGYAWMKFRHRLGHIPHASTSLRIAAARPTDGAAFAQVVGAGFELPAAFAPWLARLVGRDGWDVLLAWDGDRPVAAGACFVRDGLAWVGFGATLPSHRRWGAQSALIHSALSRLSAIGVQTVVAETGERLPGKPSASYRNLLRFGFEEVYVRQNLLCPGYDESARGAFAPLATDVQ